MSENEDSARVPFIELEQLVTDRPTQLLQKFLKRYGHLLFEDKYSQIYKLALEDFRTFALEYIQKYPCSCEGIFQQDLKYPCSCQGICQQDLEEMIKHLDRDNIIEYYEMETFFYRLMTDTILSKDFIKIFKLRLPLYLMRLQIKNLKQDEIQKITVYRGISVAEQTLQDYLDCCKYEKPLYYLNFQSCSSSETTARRFMTRNIDKKRNKQILFKIDAHHKFIADNRQANHDEQEWILDSLIQFRIKKTEKIDEIHSEISPTMYDTDNQYLFDVVVEDYEREADKYEALINDGLYSDINLLFKVIAHFDIQCNNIHELKKKYVMENQDLDIAICMQICQYLNNHGYMQELQKICTTLLPLEHDMKLQYRYNLYQYLTRIQSKQGNLDRSLAYSAVATSIAQQTEDELLIVIMQNFNGIAYTEQNQLDQAYQILLKGYQRYAELKSNIKYTNRVDMTGISNSLGFCLLSMGYPILAFPYLQFASSSYRRRLGYRSVTTAYSMLRMAQCLYCIYEEQDEFTYNNLTKLEQLVREALEIIETEMSTQEESYSRAMFLLSLLERQSERKDSEIIYSYLQSALKLPESNARFNLLKSVIIFQFPQKPNYSYLNCGGIIHFALEQEEVSIYKQKKLIDKSRRKMQRSIQNQCFDFIALNQINDLSYKQDYVYVDEKVYRYNQIMELVNDDNNFNYQEDLYEDEQ